MFSILALKTMHRSKRQPCPASRSNLTENENQVSTHQLVEELELIKESLRRNGSVSNAEVGRQLECGDCDRTQ